MNDFKKLVDSRFEAEYLLFVTSQVGDARLGVYAFGHLKPGAEIPPLPVPQPAPETAPSPTGTQPQAPLTAAPSPAGTQPSEKP
jgi:hypothetical protein